MSSLFELGRCFPRPWWQITIEMVIVAEMLLIVELHHVCANVVVVVMMLMYRVMRRMMGAFSVSHGQRHGCFDSLPPNNNKIPPNSHCRGCNYAAVFSLVIENIVAPMPHCVKWKSH